MNNIEKKKLVLSRTREDYERWVGLYPARAEGTEWIESPEFLEAEGDLRHRVILLGEYERRADWKGIEKILQRYGLRRIPKPGEHPDVEVRLRRLRENGYHEIKTPRKCSVVVVAENYGEFRRWIRERWREGTAATDAATVPILRHRLELEGVRPILFGDVHNRKDWVEIKAILAEKGFDYSAFDRPSQTWSVDPKV